MNRIKEIVVPAGIPRIVGLFFVLTFLAACDDSNTKLENSSHSAKPQSLLSSTKSLNIAEASASNNIKSEADVIKSWNGEDYGFIASAHPIRNKVEALVALGKIYAAAESYRNTSTFLSYNASESDAKMWREHARNSINQEILDTYDSLDLIFKQNNIKPFKEPLQALANLETIELYTSIRSSGSRDNSSNDNDKRQQKNTITQSSRMINASVLNAVSVLAPTRKEYMLAGSVLLRESGKALQNGLTEDGKITNPSQHQLGISQIDSALSLIPKFATNVCEEQREISQTYRESTNKIVENLMSFDNQPAQASVSDVYALAKQIEMIAKSLPEKDQDICKS